MVARALTASIFAGVVAIACGGSTFTSAGNDDSGADGASGDGSSSNDGGGSDGATLDASIDGAGDAARFNCADGGGLPRPDKTCSGGGCAIAYHTIDCCGTRVAIGIQHSTLEAFNAIEAAWESQCAVCGCAAQPTKGEDGCTPSTPGAFVAECSSNACRARCQ